MGKEFKGSWVIFVILVICFWPAAIIYFFVNYEKKSKKKDKVYQQPSAPPPQTSTSSPPPSNTNVKTCLSCGQLVDVRYQICPYCKLSTTGSSGEEQLSY